MGEKAKGGWTPADVSKFVGGALVGAIVGKLVEDFWWPPCKAFFGNSARDWPSAMIGAAVGGVVAWVVLWHFYKHKAAVDRVLPDVTAGGFAPTPDNPAEVYVTVYVALRGAVAHSNRWGIRSVEVRLFGLDACPLKDFHGQSHNSDDITFTMTRRVPMLQAREIIGLTSPSRVTVQSMRIWTEERKAPFERGTFVCLFDVADSLLASR